MALALAAADAVSRPVPAPVVPEEADVWRVACISTVLNELPKKVREAIPQSGKEKLALLVTESAPPPSETETVAGTTRENPMTKPYVLHTYPTPSLTGPFETEAEAAAWGENDQAERGDNPCWQVVDLTEAQATSPLPLSAPEPDREEDR